MKLVNFRKFSTDRALRRNKQNSGVHSSDNLDNDSSSEYQGGRTTKGYFKFQSFDNLLKVPAMSEKQITTQNKSEEDTDRQKQINDLNKIIKKKITEYSMSIVDKVINNNKFLSIKRELYPELYPEEKKRKYVDLVIHNRYNLNF